MSKLATIIQQIIGLEGDLERARSEQAAANAALINDPANEDVRDAARRASRRVADLEGDVSLLRDAKAAVEAEERSEVNVQRRKLAVEQYGKLHHLARQRLIAAKAIDKALRQFADAMQGWKSINVEMSELAGAYTKNAIRDQARRLNVAFGIGADLLNAPTNAIACQLEEAMSGLNTSSTMALNFTRRHPHVSELVERDVEVSNETILFRLGTIETTKGESA